MKVLFFIIPAYGHINSIKTLSLILSQAKIEVAFLQLYKGNFRISDTPNYKPGLEDHLFMDKTKENMDKTSFIENLFDYISGRNFKSLEKKLQPLKPLLIEYNPDVFFIDSYATYLFFLLPFFQHRMIVFNTQYNQYFDKYYPPLSSSLFPSCSFFNIRGRKPNCRKGKIVLS